MHSQRHLHYFIRTPKYKELLEMYLCMGLRTFAISLVAIFVPIYFISELNFTLSTVFMYLLTWSLLIIASSPFLAKLAAHIGFKRMIFLSAPLTILYLLMLHLMKTYPIHYFWIALLSAVSLELFWMGFHIDFAQNSHKKKRGEEISFWFSIFFAVGVIGPLLGGVIIKFIGFKTLFIIASILMLGAMIPLMMSDTKRTSSDFSIRRIFKKKYKKEALLYGAYGVKEMADSTFWPLFIFLTLKSVIAVGTIISTVAFTTAIFALFVGRLADHENTRKFVRLGALVDGISWPFRYLLTTFLPMLGVTMISFLSFIFVDIPMYKKFYDDMADHTEYVVMREISLTGGKVILILIVMLLGFKGGFWLMGLSNMAYLLM